MTAELRTVAALFVDRLGPYPNMPGVDCWDEARDARTYQGPWPVVAHPPCGPWGRQRMQGWAGNAGRECGPIAVSAVRTWGGVLEQPAGSRLWDACGLPKPFTEGDGIGFSLSVQQVSWGHVCQKPTWLYLVGVNRSLAVAGVLTGGKPERSINGKRSRRAQDEHPTWTEQLPRASDKQRRLTPPRFAEWLVSLARSSSAPRAASAANPLEAHS